MRSSSYPTLSRVQRAALARARSLAAQYTHASAGRRLLIEAAVMALCKRLPRDMPLPVDVGAVYALRCLRLVRRAA